MATTIAEDVRRHVQRLAGDIGERHVFRSSELRAACDYIQAEWRNQGYSVAAQEYATHGVRCANIEVDHPGGARASQLIVVGAHYDSVIGSPGANDNASGVAALLEISRLFATVKSALSVRFVAFVNEEPPFFLTREQGSMIYAHAARARGDDIRLMLSLETIGYYRDDAGSQNYPPFFRHFYPNRGNFLAAVSDFRSRQAMRRVVDAFRANSDFPLEHLASFRWIPGVSWSDHLSFWRHGYRAIMVTDTAFYRYPYYHTASDTPEKLAYPQLAEVATGLFRTLEALAGEGV